MDALKPSGKPFEISKWEVWEAYRQVKANRGAPGVDGVTLEEFDKDLKNNLYKIWNRMSRSLAQTRSDVDDIGGGHCGGPLPGVSGAADHGPWNSMTLGIIKLWPTLWIR